MRRALEMGKAQEEEHLNEHQERVRWRLKEVVSLDMIDRDDIDGAEVHSEFVDADCHLEFEAEFTPEKSKPSQTI